MREWWIFITIYPFQFTCDNDASDYAKYNEQSVHTALNSLAIGKVARRIPLNVHLKMSVLEMRRGREKAHSNWHALACTNHHMPRQTKLNVRFIVRKQWKQWPKSISQCILTTGQCVCVFGTSINVWKYYTSNTEKPHLNQKLSEHVNCAAVNKRIEWK